MMELGIGVGLILGIVIAVVAGLCLGMGACTLLEKWFYILGSHLGLNDGRRTFFHGGDFFMWAMAATLVLIGAYMAGDEFMKEHGYKKAKEVKQHV